MSLFSSWKQRAAWACLVFIVALVMLWTAANVWAGVRLESVLRHLARAGYPVSLSNAASLPVPIPENAAPYIQAACLLYQGPPADGPDWAAEPERRLAELSADEKGKLEIWLKANQDSFELLGRARSRPKCLFDRDYSLGFAMPLPEVTPAFKLSWALRYRAELLAERGDGPAARASVAMMLALSESFAPDPSVTSQVVRWVILRRALSATSACVTAETPADELAQWESLVPPEPILDGSLERGLRGLMGATAEYLSPSSPEALRGTTIEDLLRLARPPSWVVRPLIKWNGARYLETILLMAEACRRPYAESVVKAAELDISSRSWYGLFCDALMPSLQTYVRSGTAARAELAVVRAGVSAERQRASTEQYPARVDGRDPFTGKPLLYDPALGIIRSTGPGSGEPLLNWSLRLRRK